MHLPDRSLRRLGLVALVTGSLLVGVAAPSAAAPPPAPRDSPATPIDDSLVFDLQAILAAAPELAGAQIDTSKVTLRVASVSPKNVRYTRGERKDVYKSGLFVNDSETEQSYLTDAIPRTITRTYTLTNTHTVGASVTITSSWDTNLLFGASGQSIALAFNYNFSTAQTWTETVTDGVTFPSQTTKVPPTRSYQIEEYYTVGTMTADLDVRGVLSGDVILKRCGQSVRVPVGVLLAAERDPGQGALVPNWVKPDGNQAIVSTTSQFDGDAFQLFVQTKDVTPGEPVTDVGPEVPVSSASAPATATATATATAGTLSTRLAAAEPAPSSSKLRDFMACSSVGMIVDGRTSLDGQDFVAAEQIASRDTEILGGGAAIQFLYGDVWAKVSTLGYTVREGALEFRAYNVPNRHGSKQFDDQVVNVATDVTSAHVWNHDRASGSDYEDVMVDYLSGGYLVTATGARKLGDGLADSLKVTKRTRGTVKYGPTAVALGHGYVLDAGSLWYNGVLLASNVTDAFASMADDPSKDEIYYVVGHRGFTAQGAAATADSSIVRYTSRADVVGPGYVVDRGSLYFRSTLLAGAAQDPTASIVSAVGWIGQGATAHGTNAAMPRLAAITSTGHYLTFDADQPRRDVTGPFAATARPLPGGYVYSRGKVYSESMTVLASGVRTAPVCQVSYPKAWVPGVQCLFYNDRESSPIADVPAVDRRSTQTVSIDYVNGDPSPRIATVTIGDQSRPIAFPSTKDWNTVGTVTASFTLDPGFSEIRFSSDRTAPFIDKVTVAGTAYEAEAAANRLAGSTPKIVQGASGGLAVGNIGAAVGGGTLTMLLDAGARLVPVQIAYTGTTSWLLARVSSGGLSQSVAFPPVAADTVNTVTVNLPLLATPEPIVVSGTGTAAPCLDKLTIGTTTLEAESPSTTRGSAITVTTTKGANPVVRACSIGTAENASVSFAFDPAAPAAVSVEIAYVNPDTTVRTARVALNGAEQLVAFGPSGTSVRTVTVAFPAPSSAPATLSFRNPAEWSPQIDRVSVDGRTIEAEDSRNQVVAPAKVTLVSSASGGLVVGNLGKGAGALTIRLVR